MPRQRRPSSLISYFLFLQSFLSLLPVLWSQPTQPTTIYLSPTGSTQPGCGITPEAACGTLESAIASLSGGGGEIVVYPGTYTGPGNIGLTIHQRPSSMARIRSLEGPEKTIFDASGSSRILIFASTTTNATATPVAPTPAEVKHNLTEDRNRFEIEGITFQNGYASTGGCVQIHEDAAPTFRNCVFTNCKTSDQASPSLQQEQSGAGGAVYIGGKAYPSFEQCKFTSNWAALGGLICFVCHDMCYVLMHLIGGSVWLTDFATPIFRECTFFNESARLYGGSLVSENFSKGRFESCVWDSNWSQYGGAYDSGGTSVTEFFDSVFTNNRAELGGGIYHYADSVNLFTRCEISQNIATSNGGGVEITANAVPTFVDCTLAGNRAGGTGGAFAAEIAANVSLTNCTLIDNVAVAGGGALSGRLNAKVKMRSCLIQGNGSPRLGGGMEIADAVIVNDVGSVFAENTCDQDAGAISVRVSSEFHGNGTVFVRNTVSASGGAIKVTDNARLTLHGATIAENVANSTAGGIAIETREMVAIHNSVIRENIAHVHGGGLLLATRSVWSMKEEERPDAHVELFNTTVTGNVADEGGGIFVDSIVPLYLHSSKVVRNVARFGGGLFLETARNRMDTNSAVSENLAQRVDIFLRMAKMSALEIADHFEQMRKEPNSTTEQPNAMNLGGGGGGVYYDGETSLLDCVSLDGKSVYRDEQDKRSRCHIVNNTASYGPEEGGSPQYLVPDPTKIEISPKDTFLLNFTLHDAFGNVVTDTVDQMVVYLLTRTANDPALNGTSGAVEDDPNNDLLLIGNHLTKRTMENGFVEFGPITAVGLLNRTYSILAECASLPQISVTVKIISCGAGYQNSENPETKPYRCSLCQGSFSRVPNSDCLPCPLGATCQGSNVTADPGYWIDPDTPFTDIPDVWRCDSGNCVGNSLCAPHRQGILCSQCEENYSDWRGTGTCERCDQDAPSWLLVPIATSFVAVGVLLRFPSLCSSSVFTTLIFFVQFSNILLPTSPSADAITLTIGNLAFDWINKLTGTNCVLRINNFGRILFGGFIPLCALLACVAWGLLLRFWFWVKARFHPSNIAERPSGKMPKEMVIAWINAFLFVVLWAYLLVSRVVMRLLSCSTIAGREVVTEAPDQPCREGVHHTWWAIAWTLLVLWVIGLPVLLLAFLKWALWAGSRGSSRAQFWVEALGQIYADFRPRYWYYEFVFLLRKVVIVLLDVFTVYDPVSKSIAALLLAFFNVLVLTFLVRPWRKNRDNRIEQLLLLILFLLAGLALGDHALTQNQTVGPTTNNNSYLKGVLYKLELGGLCSGVACCIILAFPRVRKWLMYWKLRILGPLEEKREPRRKSKNGFGMDESHDSDDEDGLDRDATRAVLPDPRLGDSQSFIGHKTSDKGKEKVLDVEQGATRRSSFVELAIPSALRQVASRRGSSLASLTNSQLSAIHVNSKWAEEKAMSASLLPVSPQGGSTGRRRSVMEMSESGDLSMTP
ncbi:hypothetical protein HDU85_004267 [Gaertneriomyces sp. JEL0708]|nr:hypothetical protein HDU85_004267 [Gaertneriomyces sp. JEL0708]